MRAVKGKGNKTTERALRMGLVRMGLRGWVTTPYDVPGKPDFLFPEEKLAIFVDGCFWHGCPNCGHIPKKNTAFWETKIQRNKQRDEKNNQRLTALGYVVLRFWEHDLSGGARSCVERVAIALRNST